MLRKLLSLFIPPNRRTRHWTGMTLLGSYLGHYNAPRRTLS